MNLKGPNRFLMSREGEPSERWGGTSSGKSQIILVWKSTQEKAWSNVGGLQREKAFAQITGPLQRVGEASRKRIGPFAVKFWTNAHADHRCGREEPTSYNKYLAEIESCSRLKTPLTDLAKKYSKPKDLSVHLFFSNSVAAIKLLVRVKYSQANGRKRK
ncbi:hypothetical protein WA026_008744 [Henosepilachna vigintioctopunctata]|uniref:Uncharacterized protein n=1 Tax=Henosepilachna vigintioctopunctata TaxID=420089 RepID=A0AAW1V8M4_9CUCU